MKNMFLLIFLTFVSINFAQSTLPSITIKNLQNKPVNIAKKYNEPGKIYVFSFWATWCAPCISELEAINEYYEEWSNELNMELIAISTDDSRTQKRIRPMLNGKSWPYEVLLDSNQELKRALSIVNIPYSIVVKDQKIEHIFNGYTQGAEQELYQVLKEL